MGVSFVCVYVCVGVSPFVCLVFGQDDESSDDTSSVVYPHISYWDDGSIFLVTSQNEHIPLPKKEGMTGNYILLQAPSGEFFVDTDNQDPKIKPRYVSHLERRRRERPLDCIIDLHSFVELAASVLKPCI